MIEIENSDIKSQLVGLVTTDPSRCVIEITDKGVTIVGYSDDVAELHQKLRETESELIEIVEDRIENLPLPKLRILMVKRYTGTMKTTFKDLECKVNTADLCVNYKGLRYQVI